MNMSVPIFAAVLFAVVSLATAQSAGADELRWEKWGVMRSADGQYSVTQDYDETVALAWCEYANELTEWGWNPIKITTNPNVEDEDQMIGAGMLEGYLYQTEIDNHRANLNEYYLAEYVPSHAWPVELLNFLSENLEWIRSQVRSKPDDQYWVNAGLLVKQFEGVVAGYNMKAEVPLSEDEMWMYESAGDLLDLAVAVEPKLRPEWSKMTHEQFARRFATTNHCSGLIRLLDDMSDVMISQDAWFFFGSMNRALKVLNLNLHSEHVKAKKVAYSSYPGFLFSFDDFIMNDLGIVALETTNSVFDTTLYDKCTPESVFAWFRSAITTRMATSSKEWVDIFERYNSGSYNNQWLVIDYNRFVPGQGPKAGFLWALEQIPGYCEKGELTSLLKGQGYFPSYNTPFFHSVFDMSGYPDAVEMYGDDYSYDKCPRALIFARDAPNVRSLDDFKALMRYNDWENDELQLRYGGNGICARYDQVDEGVDPLGFGCLDTKVASYSLYSKGTPIDAISSPTYDQQPPWVFTDDVFSPHRGLKDGPYESGWIQLDW